MASEEKQWAGDLDRFRALQTTATATIDTAGSHEEALLGMATQIAASLEGIANLLSQIQYDLRKGRGA